MDQWLHGRWNRYVLFWLACGMLGLARMGGAPDAGPGLPESVRHLPQAAVVHERALQGHADAQAKLGDYCYSLGDYTNAVTWYGKAAAQGNIGAKLSLACCYKMGRGVAKNLTTADRWYRLALVQGKAPRRPKPSKPAPPAPKPAKPGQVQEEPVPPQKPAGTHPGWQSREPETGRAGPLEPERALPEFILAVPPARASARVSVGDRLSAGEIPTIPKPACCSKRVTSLQPPELVLLDVPMRFRPCR